MLTPSTTPPTHDTPTDEVEFWNDRSTDENDIVWSLPHDEQRRDGLLHAAIRRVIDNVEYHGVITDIGITKSMERVYTVRYTDGDQQDLTQDEASACRVATL